MKHLKLVGLAVLSAMALMGLSASSASATTFEESGVTKNSSITLTGSLKSGTMFSLKNTAGFSQFQCGVSHLSVGTSSPFTGSSVTGPISGLTLESCTRAITTHTIGKLEFTYTSGTNGTVASEETLMTLGSAIGTLACTTGATTNSGTLTGVGAGNATLDINALLNCGILPSAKWEATYTITSPSGLGVSS